MSTTVMAAVWPLELPPVAKSVLVSLADNANDSGYCWPSIETICQRTCFGRSAVIDAIKWLEAHEYLIPDRSNGRKTTYRLTPENGNSAPPKPVRQADGCATRTGTPDGLNQSARRTKPVRQTDTNRQEPSRTVIKNNIAPDLPDCIPPEVWGMWHEYRKRKSGKGWTEHAQKLAMRSLVSFAQKGHNIRQIVETSIERGYSGLFEPKNGATHANHSSRSSQSLIDRVASKLESEVLAAENPGAVHFADDADLRPCLG
jgi:hypothetical protein